MLKLNWISSRGKYVRLFEEEFSKVFNYKYSVAVSNGTVAIQLALKTLGIGKGDEVIVPNLTFAATINAVLNEGANPILCDISKNDILIDTDEILKKITSKTKAIIPVHLYGKPYDTAELKKEL